MAIASNDMQKWFDLTGLPAAIVDTSYKIIKYNQSFKDFFGWDDAGFSPDKLWSLLVKDSSAMESEDYSSYSLDDEKSCVFEITSNPGFVIRFFPLGEINDKVFLALIEKESENDIPQLRRALDEALESNRLKTAFLANMSHEIRTPLNTIIGFSELILDEELKIQEVQNLVEMIKTSGRSLLQLVEDIIDISRIEAGHVRINKTEVKIDLILQEMYQMFDSELKKRRDRAGVELRLVNTSQESVCVNTDPFRFRQVLINLLSNAVKFTERGLIEFGFLAGDVGLVQFYVRDTGVGIDPLMSSKVFQRFGQINQPGIHNREGAGLGMAITKQLVELMGGQIWFDSEPGKGSTFYFTLPACQPNRFVQSGLSSGLYQWGQEIFLIVDDVEANYLFLRSLFKTSGALLLWAKNGEEAIRFCRSNPDISLVLMDIQMPQTDGYEATKRIKEMNPSLPVIAQTAFADIDSKGKALKAGCDDFLIKPINKHELFTIIEQNLRRKIPVS